MANENANGEPAAGLDSIMNFPLAGSRDSYLLIVAADGTRTSRPLPAEGALTIGSGAEVDVRIEDPAASRWHASLEVAGAGGFRLIDMDSANGTRVGGKLVRNVAVAVRPGQPIRVGHTVLVVHAPSPSRRGLSPRPRPERTMAEVDALIARVAPRRTNVLLLGETGVGKGVVARRIHRESTRAWEEYRQVNCAGLSATLLESDLFGHKKGSFSGADKDKKGLLEMADGGTVFLDEIGEMPLEVQSKLLVSIEDQVIWPVGATESTRIDVRFIFATNRELAAEIRRGRFREDFYHRISQFPIHIPPLRERREEIDDLVAQFARGAAAGEQPPVFDDDARAALHRYDWPGNIRELRNVVERAVLLTEGDVVTSSILAAADLPAGVLLSLDDPAEAEDRERVIAALAECGGNQSRAAKLLGISRNTLIRRIERYDLSRPRSSDDRRRRTRG